MSMYEEDEPFDFGGRSGGVVHTGVASLDTIMQSLNKRYEVYQRRRTAMTPFGSPGDPSILVPPASHSILDDSTIVSGASVNGGGGVSGGGGAAASQPHESPKESIVFPRAQPAPYWEERELYIVAEGLCCCLNGGINYRLLCEQYQRALEVLLTLVREDLRLCVSSEMELVPGGMAKSFLAKFKALLQESRRMLGEAGVNISPRLETVIEQLPNGSSIISGSGGASHASLNAGHNTAAAASSNRGATTPAATSMAFCAGRTPNSSMMSNGRPTGTSGGGESVFATPPTAANHSGNLPSLYAQLYHSVPPYRRPPSVGMRSVNAREGEVDGGIAAAARRRPPMAPPSRPHLASPDNGYLQLGHPCGGSGDGLSRPQQQQQPAASSSSFGHFPSAGACSSTPNLANIVDNPVEGRGSAGGESVSGVDVRSSHEDGGSIKRGGVGCLNSWFSGAALTPRTSGKASPITPAGRPLQRHAPPQLAPATVKQRTVTESTSPVPATPPSDGDVPGVHGYSHTAVGDRIVGSSSAVKMQAELLAAEAIGEDANGTFAAPAPVHGRLRQLEALYGEFYAMDGMALLIDALGVVFTREYDQGTARQPKHAFTAFQQDVNGKVMPVLQSRESLQLCITDLQPLRSSYLASCLAHHVRPNNTVLDDLKNIDNDRSVETMHLEGLHLGDRGVVAFAESVLPRLYRLRWLDLSNNDVNDSALEPLLRSIRYHPSLEHLNLSRNPLTDNALPFLLRIARTLPRLSVLLLQSCAMKPATRQMVEAEVAVSGTCTVPVAAYRCSSQAPIRFSSVNIAVKRATAASEPLPGPPSGLPRLAPPRGERRPR
ncbi:conserved hypothetical protein [Leishmania major strain Friedlin]|uniref:Leucine-rich repeat protein n=1 Tax=Leishmania major TaxID=5664 RepID=Q4QG63_LEIMA|nr:conserved hypothetical protein [Leishmania major strain Friedlin]CAG9571035.1 Leucine_Rich_repeat_-_putative [Leishmania major strain Friedlin]CAJ02842.1 conserved hypothetical protein [Leishmania major strain Friedlin]|eukprot:XP_001681835.1 conserved hypothetical protein [Leishmania major strain Friedlin]